MFRIVEIWFNLRFCTFAILFWRSIGLLCVQIRSIRTSWRSHSVLGSSSSWKSWNDEQSEKRKASFNERNLSSNEIRPAVLRAERRLHSCLIHFKVKSLKIWINCLCLLLTEIMLFIFRPLICSKAFWMAFCSSMFAMCFIIICYFALALLILLFIFMLLLATQNKKCFNLI